LQRFPRSIERGPSEAKGARLNFDLDQELVGFGLIRSPFPFIASIR